MVHKKDNMQTIEVVKEYPMVGGPIKKGTILYEIESTKPGSTSYKDDDENIYSEIIFSREFQSSFKLISNDK